jgi:hypothetical protein
MVRYNSSDGLSFTDNPGGWLVFLGEDGDIKGRLEMLAAAQPTLAQPNEKPREVDLRIDRRVIYR